MSNLKKVKVSDNFWGKYQDLVIHTVIPYQEKALKDQIPDAEKSHAIENFELAAKYLETGICEKEFYGMVFQDSDLAKWLEAAAYSLNVTPNEALEKRMDELIELLGRAQHKDGYLNTYFTVKEPTRRWTNLQEAHELYCAGHMMEAAVAHYEATGKRELLTIMCKMADHIYDHFVVNRTPGYPGHPEVELALMRLYRATDNEKYLELAKHFVDVRGVDPEYYEKECQKRAWNVWGMNSSDKEYAQNQAPVRDVKEATGHSVRAVYLYTGMADLAATTGDESLVEACETLWENITNKRMYVTGAIGSTCLGEAFTTDYHLPNDTAYAETCASIGLIFFARKMLDLKVHNNYADVMERALYNCVLAGMQLDGTKFFYVNPLEVIPGISGKVATHRHTLPERPKWFGCACCPPNVARLLTSLGEYAWSIKDNTVYSHLYMGGTFDLRDTFGTKIMTKTNYPYDGTITYTFEPEDAPKEFTLALRIPEWSKKAYVKINGKIVYNKENAVNEQVASIQTESKDGYVYITKEFHSEDMVELVLHMEPVKVYANTTISADSGMVAMQYGPLVYCVEGVDNDQDVLALRIATDGVPKMKEFEEDLLSGIRKMEIDGYKIEASSELYSTKRPTAEPYKITLIPYYVWGNRGLNQMRVWIPEQQ